MVFVLNPDAVMFEPLRFAYTVTVTGGQQTSPRLTFSDPRPNVFIDWGDGSPYHSVDSDTEIVHVYALGGTYTVTIMGNSLREHPLSLEVAYDNHVVRWLTNPRDIKRLTRINIKSNYSLASDISGWEFPNTLRGLVISSTALYGDVSNWRLPSVMDEFSMYDTSVDGDVGRWTIPSSIQSFAIMSSVSPSNLLYGDISNWVWPPSAQLIFLKNRPNLTGDISKWPSLPSLILAMLDIDGCTGLTGDISGWVIPAAMSRLLLRGCSGLTGSMDTWVIPATYFAILDVHGTQLTGCPNLSQMVVIESIDASDCGLNQATVDLYLSRCAARRASCTYQYPTLNLGGNNAAPSAAGLVNKGLLTTASWTVVTN
jgi:hypothetical protein